MNKIEYLFFNIYNWFYQMSLYRPKIKPGFQTVSIFAMGGSGWVVMPFYIYIRFILHKNYNQAIMEGSLVAAFTILYLFFDSFFIDSGRYLNIYKKFVDASKSNVKRKRDALLCFLVVFAPYLLLIIYSIFSMTGLLP